MPKTHDPTRPGAAQAPRYAPLYQQVRALLVAQLEAGAWKPGEAIPSELELAARFQVAPGTLRKALDALVLENLVVRRQGRGTFVATHTEQPASAFRFLRMRRDDGVDEYPDSRLIDVRRGKAGVDVARLLALGVGEPVLLLRRVLHFADAPVVYDDITLPAVLFRGLTKVRYEAYRGPMYAFFESEFGVRILKARERIKAIAADAHCARVLGIAAGAPVLAVERVTLTFADRPVELRRGLCASAHHHYLNDLG
jgi:GntR family transcriptional regulator